MRTAGLFILLAAGCATSNGHEPAPPVTLKTIYVSPAGNDSAAGTRDAPLKTVAHALEGDAGEIVLAAGEYAEDEVVIRRKVAVLGPDDGGASITGHVRIAAGDVVFSHVDVQRGIEIEHGEGVVVDSLSVKPGENADALAISSAVASLENLDVTCGLKTCVHISTSTVSARALKLTGDGNAERGLSAETSSVTLVNTELRGTSTNQIRAGQRSRMTIRDSTFIGAQSTAVAALERSTVHLEKTRLESFARFGLVADTSRVIIRDLTTAASGGVALGFTGADADVINASIEPAAGGAITLAAKNELEATVRVIGGTIRHGNKSAVLVQAGDLTVQGTHFIGDASAQNEDGDAIVANGPTATVHVSAVFDNPAGFAVVLTANASGTVTATVTQPKTGGVYVDGVAGVPVVITGTKVDRCGKDSGFVVMDSTDVTISSSKVDRCPWAGLLAGQGASVKVMRSSFTSNVQYGLSAFGGASIEVSDSRASGSVWATFATCGDGASIDDAGGNKFAGATTNCP